MFSIYPGYSQNLNRLVKPVYYGAGDFSEGLDAVTDGRGSLIGFKDRKGRIIINAQYLTTGGFYNGYAPVNKNGKWGIIDHKGKIIVPFEFELCGSFSDGAVKVQQNGLWGYIKMPSRNYDK